MIIEVIRPVRGSTDGIASRYGSSGPGVGGPVGPDRGLAGVLQRRVQGGDDLQAAGVDPLGGQPADAGQPGQREVAEEADVLDRRVGVGAPARRLAVRGQPERAGLGGGRGRGADVVLAGHVAEHQVAPVPGRLRVAGTGRSRTAP